MSVAVAVETPVERTAAERPGQVRRSPWKTTAQRLAHDRPTVLALSVLAVLAALALGAEVLARQFFGVDPTELDLLHGLGRPSFVNPALWLGTDELGRSQVVRLLFGARVSMGVAFGAALVNLAIGIPLGLLAGYRRGLLDDVVQWLVATVHGVPRLFLLLLIASLFGPGPLLLVAVLGLLSWPGIALFVRGQVFVLREREFVLAARVMGATHARILFRHLLPNVLPLVIVLSAIDIASLILTESSLSFLGLGIQPPTPSWGNMLTNAALTMERAP